MAENVTAADQQDIAACLEGEGEAFARLMRRYQNHVVAQMRRFTREPVELDELVQDVFVEVYFSLRSFSGRGPFLHWLRRVQRVSATVSGGPGRAGGKMRKV